MRRLRSLAFSLSFSRQALAWLRRWTLLLREVEGEARESESWLSTANELLAQVVRIIMVYTH